MNCVSIKNITFSYTNDRPVVKNFSLDIKPGEYISLLGHNGCGKSTLARLLVGLLTTDQGSIEIFGQELNSKTINEIRKKIAIVFQNPDNQFIGATVEDDIAFSLENMNIPREEMIPLVKEYAEKVGMKQFLTKEPGYLSGGQKQRVAIADAMVRNPKILILDEATSMLDPQGKKEILSLVNEMRKKDPELVAISITHDIEEAYLTDRIILMHEGENVLSCTPAELFDNTDIVEEYNLELPFIIKLKKTLLDLNIDVSKSDSLESIGEKLCKLK